MTPPKRGYSAAHRALRVRFYNLVMERRTAPKGRSPAMLRNQMRYGEDSSNPS